MSILIDAETLDDDTIVRPGGVLVTNQQDGVWYAGSLDPQVLESIFKRMLFALPTDRRLPPPTSLPLTYLPNPRQRYCLDLRQTTADQWFKGRKMKKHGADFSLVVKTNFRDELLQAKSYHTTHHDGTWLTDSLIDAIQAVSTNKRDSVSCYAFVLVEKATGATAAACFGFARGRVYVRRICLGQFSRAPTNGLSRFFFSPPFHSF
jgi:hypothetical protein